MYDLNVENLKLNHLDPQTQANLRSMLNKNLGAFARHSEHLGQVPFELFHARIPLEKDRYAWSGLYKRNFRESKILDKMEKKLLRMGVFALNP